MHFVVYKSLQKKFCLIFSYEIKNPYGAARVRITRVKTRYSLEELEAHGPLWAGCRLRGSGNREQVIEKNFLVVSDIRNQKSVRGGSS